MTARRSFFTAAAASLAAGAALANTMNPQPLHPSGRFAGRTVAITGGNSGIGEATARAFAAEGATVFFCARREALGRQVQDSIRDAGGRATFIRADVRNEAEVAAFVRQAAGTGRLDLFFNNAGYFMDAALGQTPGPVDAMNPAHWQQTWETNVNGTLFGIKHALTAMKSTGQGGVIVNNASVSGHVAFVGNAAYAASKHAVIGLTRVAGVEAADANIRVVSISVLAADTPMLRDALRQFGMDPATVAQGFVTKRIHRADEIARAVMFLASDDATAMAAADLDLTGGYLAR
jgi:NAD(P)-dependent dehydrogenase (short-subunit alcohol dehydrogenase family)